MLVNTSCKIGGIRLMSRILVIRRYVVSSAFPPFNKNRSGFSVF